MTSLTELNSAVHTWHDELLLVLLEQVTALDLDGAKATWLRFTQAISEHSEFEEQAVFPPYAALDNAPRGGAIEVFIGDHDNIRRQVAAVEAQMENLSRDQANLRRRMVQALPDFHRLRAVLEHHTLREERFLYPRLASVFTARQRDKVAATLRDHAGTEA